MAFSLMPSPLSKRVVQPEALILVSSPGVKLRPRLSRLHTQNPSVGETTLEQIRVEDLCQNLQAIHDAWPRATKIGTAIHDVNPPSLHRRQALPTRLPLQDRQ